MPGKTLSAKCPAPFSSELGLVPSTMGTEVSSSLNLKVPIFEPSLGATRYVAYLRFVSGLSSRSDLYGVALAAKEG